MTGVYLLAWIIQSNLFLNWDISQLIHVANQMMSGGSYVKDFFTPNPPIILHLYIVPVFFSKLLGLNATIAFRIYIFILSTISLFICYLVLNQIISKKDSFLLDALVLSLAVTFLIVPLYQFGQRDCLLYIFSAPYLFLVALRLQGKEINAYYAFFIGLLAGLGFAIKPCFLIIPLLIELYYIYFTKRWFAWLRSETIAIFLVLATYAVIMFLFYKEYVFDLVPYLIKNYYNSVGFPWSEMILNDPVLFCLIPVAFYFIHYKDNHYKILSTVLLISLFGFLMSYFIQRTLFSYHIMPAFSTGIIMLVLLFGLYVAKYPHIFTLFLGMIFFSMPVFFEYSSFKFCLEYKKNVINKFVAFMHSQPPSQSIYFFSTHLSSQFPAVDYTDAKPVERFDCLWMVPSLINMAQIKGDIALRRYIKFNNDKIFFVNMIAQDFQLHKPNLVFVEIHDSYSNSHGEPIYLDYINYFSENRNFKNEWKSYQYLTTLEFVNFDLKFAIYKKIG